MNYGELNKYLATHQFTWLITGVAGFIGSNLMETLLKMNQKVVGMDNFATGYKSNIKAVLQLVPQQSENFIFYEGDICSFDDCRKATCGVDYVLHHAALGSIPRSIKDPITANTVNVNGFLNILTAARNNQVKRFVYASSSSVYGDSPTLPRAEEMNMGCQLSPYAVSKYANELYANVFSLCYEMETIGLRYFNVFGARQNTNGVYAAVIPLWFKAMLNQDLVYINGDGETTRDFCHVENVTQANLLAALTSNSDAVNTVYNIAAGEQITLNKLFETMRSILNISENYQAKYTDFRMGDIRHSLANINKAKSKLSYQPKHDIKSGLSITSDWYIRFFNGNQH